MTTVIIIITVIASIFIIWFVLNINKEYHSGTLDRKKSRDFNNSKNTSNSNIDAWRKSVNIKTDSNIIKPAGTTSQGNENTITWTTQFLRSLEWKRYEEVCMTYLRIKNCQANVTCVGADGGIDIKLSDSNGIVFAIAQCKSWKKTIGVNLIRELYGVMAADRVKHGIFLTTSDYSQEALEFAKNKNLLLIDCEELISLVNKLDYNSKKKLNNIATSGEYTTPTCVKCNIKMIKRTAKKGKNAGNTFWGCVNYPKCKNTMFVKGI